ncbi:MULTISPECIES: DUF488 domain-containing protein [Humibacter]|jgi:uncharacterized protein (DUF488 family)|uniref:DUF488 domain-containing protein n=1 Tax=Humibacter ginsenosidimutans TaxID=2599293 RepID=A0A5B8M5A7_9MICO|nr:MULTISPECIES: DUF488 domain-containing protein [Humibacter]QDZ15948.1 DUF488 domain-containing protein [Humibacter ginsenosidimutans]
MWEEQWGITGIGYEGQSVETFVLSLERWQVKTLFDVRLNPLSRKPGFSKNAMRSALEEHGIEYVHLPALGNPKDNRDGYGELGTETANAARGTFKLRLNDETAQEALDMIVTAAERMRVVVMCFEGNTHNCHREQVLEEVECRLRALVSA